MQPASTRSEPVTRALTVLTAVNAALYFGAAALHLGVKVPLGFATLGFPQPIPPASIAEGLIGGTLAAAGVALALRGRAAWGFAWGAYVAALLGTLFGLAIVLLRQLGGPDLGVHAVMLAGLASGFALLIAARRPSDSLAERSGR